jgi:uncharacterized membrane protein
MKGQFINYGLGIGAFIFITLIGVACLSFIGNLYPLGVTESGLQSDVLVGGIQQVGFVGVIVVVLIFAGVSTYIFYLTLTKSQKEAQKHDKRNQTSNMARRRSKELK